METIYLPEYSNRQLAWKQIHLGLKAQHLLQPNSFRSTVQSCNPLYNHCTQTVAEKTFLHLHWRITNSTITDNYTSDYLLNAMYFKFIVGTLLWIARENKINEIEIIRSIETEILWILIFLYWEQQSLLTCCNWSLKIVCQCPLNDSTL